MADGNEADEWDEWGDEVGASSPQTTTPAAPLTPLAPPSSPPVSGGSNAASAAPESHEKPPNQQRELLDWRWDLHEIDADLAVLPPSHDWTLSGQSQEGDALCKLAALAGPTRARLLELGERTRAMRSQALVAQWNLMQLQQSLQTHHADEADLSSLDRELRGLAGDWGVGVDQERANEVSHQQLHEMSNMLQHALDACGDDGDVTPFQQAIEQLFGSLPDQRLVVPTSWIRAATDPTTTDKPSVLDSTSYLQRLVSLCDADERVQRCVAAPSVAQTLQDTKDVQRDELVVNGEHVVGRVGYDHAVGRIESQLRQVIARTAPPSVDDDTTLRRVAQQVLTACNRTESGGASYEILSQFVSNHAMDHVLIRPASAKAPPLEIQCDVGAFNDQDGAWCFGLRVAVAAVTWYCICEVNDPTHEFYDVKTTYANRLAFSLGRSALSPSDLMRRDGGSVTITLGLDDEPRAGSGTGDGPVEHESVD